MSSINQTDQDHRAGDLPFPERFYRRLLRLYPDAIHRGFGRDMDDVFRDLRRAERRDRGGVGAAVFAVRACAEIPLQALEAYREHWRETGSRKTDRTAAPPLESRRVAGAACAVGGGVPVFCGSEGRRFALAWRDQGSAGASAGPRGLRALHQPRQGVT